MKGAPPEGAVGLTLKIIATDQHGDSTFQTFNIGTPPGGSPTFDVPPTPIVLDWSSGVAYDSGPAWYDLDGDDLTFSAYLVSDSDDPATVDLSTLDEISTIGLSIDPDTGEISGAPTDVSNGFIIVASDGTGITDPGRSSVISFNQPPVTDPESAPVSEDGTVTILAKDLPHLEGSFPGLLYFGSKGRWQLCWKATACTSRNQVRNMW